MFYVRHVLKLVLYFYHQVSPRDRGCRHLRQMFRQDVGAEAIPAAPGRMPERRGGRHPEAEDAHPEAEVEEEEHVGWDGQEGNPGRPHRWVSF